MKPSAETEATGMKAYEQARAFERLRTWRLPLTQGALALVPVLNGALLGEMGHAVLAELSFTMGIILAVMAWLHGRGLKARYARNLQLLEELQKTYGDQLPWIQVENHFAALERLKRELADPAGRQ